MFNPYEILGVSKTSSNEEIKKRYKLLAKKYHPDRNHENKQENEEKFKEISKSYDILSDAEKRHNFDLYGNDGPPPMSSSFGFPFGNFQPKITKHVLPVSLEEIYNEKNIEFKLKLKSMCMSCLGQGTKDKTAFIRCISCNGQGQKMKINMLAPGFVTSTQSMCEQCQGIGKQIKPGFECNECKGNKIIETRKPINIQLKQDTRNGETIVLKNQGHINLETKEKDDLVIIIEFNKHDIYNVENDDLHLEYKVQLIDALCGFDFIVRYLDNTYLHVKEENIIRPFSKKIIRNKGINQRGNMVITFNVVFPMNNLSAEKKKYIRKLLESKNKRDVFIPQNSQLCYFSNYIEKEHTEEQVGCATQ